MKADIFEVKRFAVHDGNGIRTTVFLKGCPLRCVWCHNPEGISPRHQLAYYESKCKMCGRCAAVCDCHVMGEAHTIDREKCTGCGKCEKECFFDALKLYGKQMTAQELLSIVAEDRDFYETSDGGVTLSGGECLMQADFCEEFLKLLKSEGYHTAVDTCGFVKKEVYDRVMPYTDIFLYDMKAFDEDVHIKCTGVSNKIIIENLKYIDSCGCKTEIRIPYVPDYNDNQIEKIGTLLTELKNLTGIRVLPYHNYAGSKYASLAMENTLPQRVPEDSEIKAAEKVLSDMGLKIIG